MIAIWALVPFLMMCSSSEHEGGARKQPASDLNASAQPGAGTGSTSPGSPGSPGSKPGVPTPKATSPVTGTDPSPTATASNAPPPPSAEGQKFYISVITPLFEKPETCYSCHAPPRTKPSIPAPLSVFDYVQMQRMLVSGQGSTDNILFNKVRNRVKHGGSDRCQAGNDVTPCKELAEWWKLENAGKVDLKAVGELKVVSETGTLGGYAVDPDKAGTIVSVKLYLDGPSGTGIALPMVQANLTGYGSTQAFTGAIPLANIDAKEHKLYAYALINGQEKALTNSPLTYIAYKPNLTQGKAFFDANVSAGINSCGGCHGTRDYQSAWSSILSPAKHKGGTATNNFLVQKLSGVIAHQGGNTCGNPNGGVCAQIQQWYNIEFP